MRSVIFTVFLCFCCACSISAQPLSAFVDIQNQLMVWDRGMIHKIDFMPPTQMKIGRTAIPYLDNSRSFKIYYGGSVREVNIGFTNAFFVTDNLVAYLNQKSLSVFDNEMISQIFMNGYEIAEVTCPTKYFEEASSINFKRSMKYGRGVLRVSLTHRFHKWGLVKSNLYGKKK